MAGNSPIPNAPRRCWRFALALLAALSAAASPTGAAPAADDAIMENASTRVVLRGGRIVSLLDKARSIEHVAPGAAASAGLFRLQWVRGTAPAGDVDATQAAARITRRAADRVELEYDHPRALCRVRVELAGSPGESRWSISVQPKERNAILGRVDFPSFATPMREGGEERKYLFPMFEGRFLPLSQPPLWRTYPAETFAQLMGCLGPAGGFLLWTDDGAGHAKSIGYQRQGNAALFGVRHLLPHEARPEWTQPYDVRLSFCGAAWQDAADIYRAWVTTQPWSNTPLRARADAPAVLRHPPLCISSQLDKEDLETLPDRLAAWGRRFGAPVVYRPLGWEKHGNWVGIDYLPPSIGEERFRALAARLRERGILLCGFISGYRWTTRNERGTAEQNRALQEYFEAHGGAAVCERGPDGRLLPFQSEGRDSYRICRGTPFGREFLQKTAASLFDLGFTIIHDDQDHGMTPNGTVSCFDAAHGHPVPCGPWSTLATRDSLRAIKAEAARRGVEGFFLTKETCSEMLNLELTAYQARYFHESSTPGLVPLSQYLYHETIPTAFGWVTAQERSLWSLAAMLVYGQVPSLAFWNAAATGPETIPAASLTLLGDYYGAMPAYARDFLLYGRMRRPLIADAPAEKREIRQAGNRVLPRPQSITVPLVIQSAWEDTQGNVAVFAANTRQVAADLHVQAPGPGRWRATLYAGTTVEAEREVAGGDTIAWRLSPGRLGAVVFRRGD